MSNFNSLEARVAVLEAGVLEHSTTEASVPVLEGVDNGLYSQLGFVAHRLGYRVEDSDDITKEILKDGRRGLNKRFFSGPTIMIKQGAPLQMAATIAHEIGHHFTPPINDTYGQIFAEVVAEGTAFIVCDHQGLDISPQAFPYIAGYRKDGLTTGMKDDILAASTTILGHLHEID